MENNTILSSWIKSLKHFQGQHNQLRHGWRYGRAGQSNEERLEAVRQSMLRNPEERERDEYRNRMADRDSTPGLRGTGYESPAGMKRVVSHDPMGQMMDRHFADERRRNARDLKRNQRESLSDLFVSGYEGDTYYFRTTPSSDNAKIDEAVAELKKNGVDVETVVGGFNFTHEASGMTSKVIGITSYSSVSPLYVGGAVFNKDGNQVGYFSRQMNIDSEGKAHVHNGYFVMSEDFRGTGFGAAFYRNSEEAYKAGGISYVSIRANISVGSYAWAKMGFKFAEASEAVERNTRASNMWVEEARENVSRFNDNGKPLSFPQPNGPRMVAGYNVPIWESYELAAIRAPWDDPDSFGLGKRSMLGSGNSWDAIKYLNESDDGYQVGQTYYREKDKKKR